MLRTLVLVLGLVLALPGQSHAQTDPQTLADIRQELSSLYVSIQSLRTELSTSGQMTQGIGGNTPLERLDAIEAEVQRLTSKTEELEFRINRITVDGTNRVGDLEFRLCELETGCDIGQLGDTPSLGGVDSASNIPTPVAPPENGGPDLAIGEQSDFDRAQGSLDSGDFRGAADQFAAFTSAYPGSPLSARAHFGRGQALEAVGEMTSAARAYLDAFSANPTGPTAADALFKLGFSLGALGQTQDACVTLAEVGVRFPGSPATAQAQSAMANLGCS
jgi:tol-pal system protein YbgF